MNIGVAFDEGQIAANLGSCKQVLVVTTEGREPVSKHMAEVRGTSTTDLIKLASMEQIDVLICGSLGLAIRNALEMIGVLLVPGCEGPAEEAVAKFLVGEKQGDPTLLEIGREEDPDDPMACMHDCAKCSGCAERAAEEHPGRRGQVSCRETAVFRQSNRGGEYLPRFLSVLIKVGAFVCAEMPYLSALSSGILRKIKAGGMQMSTMDTNFALDMEREERRAAGCPWRRYFARQFDFALYGLLWSLAAQWGLRLNIGGSYVMLKVLSTVVGAVLMVVIEPFLLHFWGTTPGKWLFGMEIRTPNGEKLAIRTGFYRTWQVFTGGMGWDIPIWAGTGCIRAIRRARQASCRGTLTTAATSSCMSAKTKWYRVLMFLFAWLLVLAAEFGISLYADLPRNTGRLTFAQYVDNCNNVLKYHVLGRSMLRTAVSVRAGTPMTARRIRPRSRRRPTRTAM